MKLSEKLFMVRTAKKLSKREVANRLDMDVTTYGRLEKGESSLNIEKLKLVPEALDIKPQELLELLGLNISTTFNMSGNNGKEYGFVQTLNTNDKETLAELRALYSDIIKEKDNLISQLKGEIEILRKS